MATILQVSGMVAVTAGALWVSIPAGLIVGGIFLVLVGFALGK